MQTPQWLVLVYRVPSEPASKRVTIWRDIKRIGALYLQQCVCILPQINTLAEEVERVRSKIVDAGGESLCIDVPALRPADETKIIGDFRALRNKEYDEIIEECETKFVKEIEFERFRENYTFEEAEEIREDLDKIRRWLAKIEARDWLGADGRAKAHEKVAECERLMDEFEADVYERANPDDA